MGALYNQMRMDLELKNFNPKNILLLLGLHGGFSPALWSQADEMGEEEIRNYLYYLMKEKKVSQSSINQACSAIKFFYEMTMERKWNGIKNRKKLPVVLAREEMRSVLRCIDNLKHRAILTTIYPRGLRMSEATHLKPSDIDGKRMMIWVQAGKRQQGPLHFARQAYPGYSERVLEGLSAHRVVVSRAGA